MTNHIKSETIRRIQREVQKTVENIAAHNAFAPVFLTNNEAFVKAWEDHEANHGATVQAADSLHGRPERGDAVG
jgi:hypothetical protein